MVRKKDGGEKQIPIPIHEINLMDWYAAFALLNASPMATAKESAKAAFDMAEACLNERKTRIQEI
jgi:hypothetical protein